ncbi:MAG: hypothetical protein ACRCYY_05860 [Trueperaceae bacterium]
MFRYATSTSHRFVSTLTVVVLSIGCFIGVVLAQDTTTTLDTAATTELRHKAMRLTLESKISELPPEIQTEARALLARAENLHLPLLDLRAKMLSAYVAELEAGQEPYLAREVARNAVTEERIALLPELRSLLRDARSFVRDHPEVKALLGGMRGEMREGLRSRLGRIN